LPNTFKKRDNSGEGGGFGIGSSWTYTDTNYQGSDSGGFDANNYEDSVDEISFFNEKVFVSPENGERRLSHNLNMFLGTLDPDEEITKLLTEESNRELLGMLANRDDTRFIALLLGEMTKPNMRVTCRRLPEVNVVDKGEDDDNEHGDFASLEEKDVIMVASSFSYFLRKHRLSVPDAVKSWGKQFPPVSHLIKEHPGLGNIFEEIGTILINNGGVNWQNHSVVRSVRRSSADLRGRIKSLFGEKMK